MTLYGVNNGISLQESQLIQMLQQQAARARSQAGHAHDHAQATGAGQNMPGEQNHPGSAATGSGATVAQWQPADPALSPENINALLLHLQTQQSSLDTTLLLSGSDAGPGGKTLVDYLTDPDDVANGPTSEDGDDVTIF